jgi:hypothetical protein
VHGSDEIRNSLGLKSTKQKQKPPRLIITCMAETITTHTQVHTPHLLFSQGGISLAGRTGLLSTVQSGAQMQAIINFGHLPQGTHTGEENGAL